jgi:hypothetical protein
VTHLDDTDVAKGISSEITSYRFPSGNNNRVFSKNFHAVFIKSFTILLEGLPIECMCKLVIITSFFVQTNCQFYSLLGISDFYGKYVSSL